MGLLRGVQWAALIFCVTKGLKGRLRVLRAYGRGAGGESVGLGEGDRNNGDMWGSLLGLPIVS